MTFARMFDAKTVAELLDCSQRTVRRRIAEGTMASVRIGGLRRVSEHELERLIHGGRADWSDASEERERNDQSSEILDPFELPFDKSK